jgi:16S rRNA processing protein RimM
MPRGSIPPVAAERADSRANPSGERGVRAKRPPSPSPAEGQCDLILLGEFGRAHGLKGEVRLKSFTAEPAAIASYGPLVTDDRRRFVLKAVRVAGGGSPDMLVARVEGVATREAA